MIPKLLTFLNHKNKSKSGDKFSEEDSTKEDSTSSSSPSRKSVKATSLQSISPKSLKIKSPMLSRHSPRKPPTVRTRERSASSRKLKS